MGPILYIFTISSSDASLNLINLIQPTQRLWVLHTCISATTDKGSLIGIRSHRDRLFLAHSSFNPSWTQRRNERYIWGSSMVTTEGWCWDIQWRCWWLQIGDMHVSGWSLISDCCVTRMVHWFVSQQEKLCAVGKRLMTRFYKTTSIGGDTYLWSSIQKGGRWTKGLG